MAKIELSPKRNLESGTQGALRPPKRPRSLILLAGDVIGLSHFIAANALMILIDEVQAREIMYSYNIFEKSPIIELVLRFLDWPIYGLYLKYFTLPNEVAAKYMIAEGIVLLSSILYAFVTVYFLKFIKFLFNKFEG